MAMENKEVENQILGDTTERDAKIKALEELIQKAKANAKHYDKIKSKVYKGMWAQQGSLFFGVVVKHEKMIYKNVVLLNCKGKDEETEQLLYNELFSSLCKKYDLKITKDEPNL